MQTRTTSTWIWSWKKKKNKKRSTAVGVIFQLGRTLSPYFLRRKNITYYLCSVSRRLIMLLLSILNK
jgi:hypothetical protein